MCEIIILRTKSNTGEKGIALITVMLMLAVLTVLGITMANTSIIETHISSNYRTSKKAFFDADAGIQYALAKIQAEINSVPLEEIDPSGYSALEGFSFSLSSFDNILAKGGGESCFTSTGFGQNNAEAQLEACIEIAQDLHPAFKVGVFSDGDINFSEKANIIGNIHSNSHVNLNSSQSEVNGYVSAHGTTNVGGKVFGGVNEYADKREFPPIPKYTHTIDDETVELLWSQEDLSAWHADESITVLEYHDDHVFHDMDVVDTVILVKGDATITNKTTLKNVTMMVTGNINFRGSSQNDDGINKNIIIAGGNIEFQGSRASYAAFWCGEYFVISGTSTIHGSIVAGGSIESEGQWDLVYDGTTSSENLPTINKLSLKSWFDTSLDTS